MELRKTLRAREAELGEAQGLFEEKSAVVAAWREAAEIAEGKVAVCEERALRAESQASTAMEQLAAVHKERELLQGRYDEHQESEERRLVAVAEEAASLEEDHGAQMQALEARLTAEWQGRVEAAERGAHEASEALATAHAERDEALAASKAASEREAAAAEVVLCVAFASLALA